MAKHAEGCAVLRLSKAAAGVLEVLEVLEVLGGFGGFKAWPKRAMEQLRSPIETVCRAHGEVRWPSKRRVVRC